MTNEKNATVMCGSLESLLCDIVPEDTWYLSWQNEKNAHGVLSFAMFMSYLKTTFCYQTNTYFEVIRILYFVFLSNSDQYKTTEGIL